MRLIISLLAIIIFISASAESACDEKYLKEWNDHLHKQKGLIICSSKEPISDPNHNCIPCVLAREIDFEANLFTLYNNGWKLVQILKTDKGYLYYLDK